MLERGICLPKLWWYFAGTTGVFFLCLSFFCFFYCLIPHYRYVLLWCEANVARFLEALRASWASRKRALPGSAHIRFAQHSCQRFREVCSFFFWRRECCALPPTPDRRLMSPLGTWVCATGRRRQRCVHVCTRAPWRASRKRRALAWVLLPKAPRSGARSRARQQYIYV
jgi:hypothetical protein